MERSVMKLIFILSIILVSATHAIDAVSLVNYFEYQKGYDYYQNEDYDNALIIFSKMTDSKEKSGELYTNLGNTYFKKGDYKRALSSYKTASELFAADKNTETQDQHHAIINYNAGTAALSGNNYKKAIKCFRESLKKNPKEYDAKYNIEIAILKLKEQEKNRRKEQNKKKKKEKKKNLDEDENKKEKEKEIEIEKEDMPSNVDQHEKITVEESEIEKENKEKAKQLLDTLSRLEKEARQKHKKLPTRNVTIEQDW